MSKQKLKFLVGGIVVVAALATLMAVSFQGNMAYYIEVSEFLNAGPGTMKGNVRVKGNVVPGTIQRTPGQLGAVFQMTDGSHTMTVSYHKELPDTFVDDAEVVVEGELGSDRVFQAHTLLAKCPSKYEAEGDYPTADPA